MTSASTSNGPSALTTPLMPFYVCVDGTLDSALVTESVRALTESVAMQTAGSELPDAIRIAVVAYGATPDLVTALADVELPPVIPSLLRSGPTNLSSLYEWLEGLLAHDVAFYKTRALPVLRPLVFILTGSRSIGTYDREWFDHLTSAATVQPVVMSLGFADADPSIIVATQTAGAWIAAPGKPESQFRGLLELVRQVILATADRITKGTLAIASPESVDGVHRLDTQFHHG